MENNKPKKFLFIGRTASGKSSIAKAVCEKMGLKQVKSYTTRPARPGEDNDNADHYFITKEEFDLIMSEHIDRVAAYTKINDFEYCTTTDILDKSDIYVIDPDGVNILKTNCGDKYEFIEGKDEYNSRIITYIIFVEYGIYPFADFDYDIINKTSQYHPAFSEILVPDPYDPNK